MIYTIFDTHDLISKIEEYEEHSNDSNDVCGYFLIKASINEGNKFRLIETFSLTEHICLNERNVLLPKTDFIENKLREFKETNCALTIVYTDHMNNMSTCNIEPYNATLIYEIMRKGRQVDFNSYYIVICMQNDDIKARVYRDGNVYKETNIVRNNTKIIDYRNPDLFYRLIF